MANRRHSKALTLLKCVARRRQRLFTYIHHAEHTVSSLLRVVFAMWINTRLYHLSVTLSHIYRATDNYTNTHERRRDMHGRVWCVRDDDTFQCLRVHIVHSFIYDEINDAKRTKRFPNQIWGEKKTHGKCERKNLNSSWKSCFWMIRMELLFSHWRAVERFQRMKTRNKMASRANKEKRKKSTATPIASNNRSTNTTR